MASSRHRHRRRAKNWPLLGLGAGGVAIAAAVVALAIGISQAAGSRACAAGLPAAVPAGLPAAAQAQRAGIVTGIATHYVLQGLPNCSYPSPPADGLFVAMPPGEYASAAACGGYLEVHGPGGSVRVEVIDQCPDCGPGHIDLSEAAFSAIAPLSAGLVNVSYQYLASPSLPGPVSLRVKEGSSPYWLALLAMNTGNPLASVQVESEPGGGWNDLVRASYNYWIAQSGAGPGPFTVRLTDTAGHVVTVRGITLSPGVVQDTGTWMYGPGATSSATAPPVPAPSTARVRASSPAARPRPRPSPRRGAVPASASSQPAPALGRPTASPTC
ncbi:MAG TPA: expansin EXLX1 family cellulose-binding protein [Trebonia sp.]